MKLLKANLRGFIGIQKGMGLEEISLDLSDLSGLVALSGPNGNGKTTVLENLHVFRTLASRNNSLKKHVFLRDSHRDIEFLFGGNHYRSLIKIDSDSDRSEAFLWENGNSLVDGKVSNYDEAVIERFGTKELFFNSVFCAQNSKKLSDLRPGELKKLFGEFLRLERYNRWEKNSKDAITIIAADQSSLDERIKELVKETDEKDSVLAAINNAKVEKDNAERGAKFSREKIDVLEIEHKEASSKAAKNAVLEEQIAGNRKQIDSTRKAIDDEVTRVNGELDFQRDQYRKINGEIKDLESFLADRPKVEHSALRAVQVRSELNDARSAFDKADQELSRALLKEKAVSDQMAAKEREKIDAERTGDTGQSLMKLADVKNRIGMIDTETKNLGKDSDLAKLESELEACRKQTANLAGFIDDPNCRKKECRFIADAMESEKSVPEIERKVSERKSSIARQVKKLSDEKEALEKEAAKIQGEIDTVSKAKNEKIATILSETYKLSEALDHAKKEVKDCSAKRSGIKEKIKSLETDLSKFEAGSAKIHELSVAFSKIDGLKSRLAEIEAEGKKVREALDAYEKGKHAEIAEIEKTISDLESKKNPQAAEKAERLKKEIDDHKAEAEKAEKQAAVLEERIKALEKDLRGKEQAEKKLRELRERKKFLVTEASDWTYLRDACGRNGLPSLEIDSVAPMISAFANELLMKSFGPNFLVNFKTQDDNGREILDIVTTDERGDEAKLENLSGGQRIWLLKALQLSLSLLAKQKSGRAFQSVFSDEEDGALDEENAINFIQMYRAFMEAGRFDDCYFISHRKDCIDMADNLIEFSKNGISIN